MFRQIAERVATYLNIQPEDGEAPLVPPTLTAPLESPPLKTAAARSQ
jgi:hypothetical protein